MGDVINLVKNVANVEVSPEFDTYTKVIIGIDDNEEASAGNDRGQVLEITNPLFGDQEVAEKILARFQRNNFRYQPYKMDGAILDPASEIGDAVSANGVFGGVFNRERAFGRLMKANVSAPAEEEINHEYKYESPQERKVKRQVGTIKSELAVHATEIMARVKSVEGAETDDFWWRLTDKNWTVGSGSTEIFKIFDANADKAGEPAAYKAKIKGEIIAESGTIGGFTIGASAIYKNYKSMQDDSTDKGVYIGTDGIKLGKNFKVDNQGNLTAKSGTFSGPIHAKQIISSGENDRINGDSILGKGSIGGGGGGALSGGVVSGVNGGKNFTAMTTQQFTANYIMCNNIRMGAYSFLPRRLEYVDPGGKAHTMWVIGAG